MIERHYGHLDADRQTMRKLLCSFMAGRKARSHATPLPAELVEQIASLVQKKCKRMGEADTVNLRTLLSEFRMNGEEGKTRSCQPADASHGSGE